MEIVTLNNEKFVVLYKTKKVSDDLLSKIKLSVNADVVLFNNSNNTIYYCSYIENAKFEDVIENKMGTNELLTKILSAYGKFNYVFRTGLYNLNVFGIRSSNNIANSFDDLIGIFYQDEQNSWNIKTYKATTDPGSYWLQNPMNVEGTSILIPGQYFNSHKIGLHKGQYRALVQNTILKVWRDKDKDNILEHDSSSIDAGMFGINIHHAGLNSTQIDKWSAGCQVFANLSDFNEFMNFVDKQINNGFGDVITYTLFDENQI